LNLPFIIIDGVGAAESSYILMAWFARPSFRHLVQGWRLDFLIARITPLGTCHKLQVVDFNPTAPSWLSVKEPSHVGRFAEFLLPNPFVDFIELVARGAI
jgi:hypothetical protein